MKPPRTYMRKSSSEEVEDTGKEMVPPVANSIHGSTSRPKLIQGDFEERDPTILLPNQSDDISHLALDIGGKFSSLSSVSIN